MEGHVTWGSDCLGYDKKVMRGLVELQFVPTKQQVADFLTKNLPELDFRWCRKAYGLYVEGEHVEVGDGMAYGK